MKEAIDSRVVQDENPEKIEKWWDNSALYSLMGAGNLLLSSCLIVLLLGFNHLTLLFSVVAGSLLVATSGGSICLIICAAILQRRWFQRRKLLLTTPEGALLLKRVRELHAPNASLYPQECYLPEAFKLLWFDAHLAVYHIVSFHNTQIHQEIENIRPEPALTSKINRSCNPEDEW